MDWIALSNGLGLGGMILILIGWVMILVAVFIK